MIALIMEGVCSRRTCVFVPVPTSYDTQIHQPEQPIWALCSQVGYNSLERANPPTVTTSFTYPPCYSARASLNLSFSALWVWSLIKDIVLRYKWPFLNTNQPSRKGPDKKQSVLTLEKNCVELGAELHYLPIFIREFQGLSFALSADFSTYHLRELGSTEI